MFFEATDRLSIRSLAGSVRSGLIQCLLVASLCVAQLGYALHEAETLSSDDHQHGFECALCVLSHSGTAALDHYSPFSTLALPEIFQEAYQSPLQPGSYPAGPIRAPPIFR